MLRILGYPQVWESMKRIVEPEILDDLAPDDPNAVRSRKDLRLINRFMAGEAWILKQVSNMKNVRRIVELGAGDGQLSNALKSQQSECVVVALDLVPRPKSAADGVIWESVSVLDYDGYDEHCIVVANLFIHHLQDSELRSLGEKLKDVRAVVFAEPHRKKSALCMGRLIFPVVNHVTRHDMITSIKAGFVRGEIEGLLGSGFQWSEGSGFFGGIRMIGERQ